MAFRREVPVCFGALLTSLVASAASQAKPAPVPVPTTQAYEMAGGEGPEAATIPRETLVKMYERELGRLFHSGDFDAIYKVHEAIESYFAATTTAARKNSESLIETSGVDPVVIGRLTRLRTHWPQLTGGAVYYVNEQRGPYTVRYFCGTPKGYDRAKPWPLVIKLPTASAFLTDPPPDAQRVLEIYTTWIKDELEHHPEAAVLMPLLNLDEVWGPSYQGMSNVIQPMLHAAGRINIDPARVYLIGHSESAHAVWNLALHYPTYFAAINCLAGGAGADWQRLRLINLRNVLPVVWHDDDDLVIKPESSRAIVRALRGLKIDVEFIQTKNVGHAPTPAIADECYEKTAARVRDLYPRDVSLQSNRPDPIFNRNDWLQAWQAISPGSDRRLYFRHGSGYMVVCQNPLRLDGNITGNLINIKSDNVASMRIYLNDQLLDLTRPVTIVLNQRRRFEGLAKPNVQRMLNDQLFLGRGWRYYPSEIDIDIAPLSATRPTTRRANSEAGPHEGNPTVHSAPHGGTITIGPKN